MYEWLPRAMALSKKIFQAYSLDCGFDMGGPATIAEINECEQSLNFSFPPSHREFLRRYNGASLFRIKGSFVGDIEVHGTRTLLEYWLERKEFCDNIYTDVEEYPQAYPIPLPIAYLGRVGTGDFCALKKDELIGSEYPVLDCDYELSPCEWKKAIIATSFEEWLKTMFKNVIEHRSMPEYWYEENRYEGSIADWAALVNKS